MDVRVYAPSGTDLLESSLQTQGAAMSFEVVGLIPVPGLVRVRQKGLERRDLMTLAIGTFRACEFPLECTDPQLEAERGHNEQRGHTRLAGSGRSLGSGLSLTLHLSVQLELVLQGSFARDGKLARSPRQRAGRSTKFHFPQAFLVEFQLLSITLVLALRIQELRPRRLELDTEFRKLTRQPN
jgi:hypothetical protein